MCLYVCPTIQCVPIVYGKTVLLNCYVRVPATSLTAVAPPQTESTSQPDMSLWEAAGTCVCECVDGWVVSSCTYVSVYVFGWYSTFYGCMFVALFACKF